MAFAFKQPSSPGDEAPTREMRSESRLPGLDHLLLREKRDSFDEDARSPSLPPATAISIARPSTGRLDDYSLSSTAPARFSDDDRAGPSAHRPSVSSIHSLLNGLSVDTDVAPAHASATSASSSTSRQTPTRGPISRVASSPNLTPRASSSSRFAPNHFGYHMPPPPTAASSSTSASASSFRRLSGEEDAWSDADSTSSANMLGPRPNSSSSRLSSSSSASFMQSSRAPPPAGGLGYHDRHAYPSPSYNPAYQNQMQQQQQSAMSHHYPGNMGNPSTTVHPSNHSRAPISRTTKACNACRSRKVRCDAGGQAAVLSGEELPCSRCQAGGVACVYSGQQRKRGPTPGSAGAGRPPLSKRKSSMAGPYASAMGGPAFDPNNGPLSHSVRSSFSDFRLTTPPDEWASQFPPGQVSPGSGPRVGPSQHRGSYMQQPPPPAPLRYGPRPASPHDVRYDSRYPGVPPQHHHDMDERRGSGYPAQPSPMSMPGEHYMQSQPGYATSAQSLPPIHADKRPTPPHQAAASSLSGWSSPANSEHSPRLAMSTRVNEERQPRSSFPSHDPGVHLPPLRTSGVRGSV